jgi:hypothetical protein
MLKGLLERLKPFLAYPNATLSKMENDEKNTIACYIVQVVKTYNLKV